MEKTRLRRSWFVLLSVVAAVGLVAALSVPSLLRARRAMTYLPEVHRPHESPTLSATPPAPPVPLLYPKAARPDAKGVRSAMEAGSAEGLDLGVVGGVAGGVPGGVVGGVVGGIADAFGPVPRGNEAGRAREFNTEAYDLIRDNPFLAAAGNPLSTFSVDVDTASYANVRRFLQGGQLPPKDAVRIEELVNYFRYEYPDPEGDAPFSITTQIGDCPWKPGHRLALVGLQGKRVDARDVPPRNLVFLIDVSGSMASPDKLPLLKEGMALLVDQLRPEDRVAITVYAGTSGLVLPPTRGDRKAEIKEALQRLEAGGSTAGGAGIQLAYKVAADTFLEGGINRVILATDGDFNVGVTSQGDLVRLIEEKRKTGVFLSVLGFGTGNLKDSNMEKLADSGNGNYAYVDSLSEARKVLVSEAGSTLFTIAKDVKIQVEWNPRHVSAYRLLGYENRVLRSEDFADDKKDAGEIGAGHSVTALYEIVPAGTAAPLPSVDPLKYQDAGRPSAASANGEVMTVKLRYKAPDGEKSRLLSVAVREGEGASASTDLRFASAVAAFGMLLRDSEHKGDATFETVRRLALEASDDASGYRAEFLGLVAKAESLAAGRRVAITR